MSFAHLHVRSAYSFLRGTIGIRELVKRTVEFNMPAVALTDLGQMFGIWKFYREAVKAGIKPILGVEAYVAQVDVRTHLASEEPGTMVLLAKDLAGYRNLTRLTARANMEGFFHHPRVDLSLLKELGEGLIALSSGVGGEIPKLLAMGEMELAVEKAKIYMKTFPGRFYLELQGNNLPGQGEINDALCAISSMLGIPTVIASEARYLNREDHSAYKVLECIRTRKPLDFEKSRDLSLEGEFYFKGPVEMRLDFANHTEALSNTLDIASMCQVDFPEKRLFAVPRPDIGLAGLSPDDFQMKADDHFLKLCREALERTLKAYEEENPNWDPDLAPVYQTRLRKETSDILESGASLYFLVVSDYVKHARDQGLLVGPGRGFAPGSLVNYLLGITELDPIHWGLSFELFLNTYARDYPTIDVEIPFERAEELINYIEDTYGGSHFVAHSLKLNLLKGRTLLREVGQVFGVPLPLLDELCGMHPTHARISLKMAVDEISLIKTFAESIPVIKKIIDFALFLENLPRTASSHPFSLVASPRLLRDTVPLFLDYNSGSKRRHSTTVQYGADAVEENGLLRFDIFPQKTLSLIKNTLRLIGQNNGYVSLEKIPLDDKDTLDLLSVGNFSGIPYLESPWVGNILRPLKGILFSDLVIICGLHPPLSRASGLAEEYVELREGKALPQSLHVNLDPILKESFGLILFREQVLEIVEKTLGNRTPEAEILTRSLASGEAEELSLIQPGFLARAMNNGYDAREASSIWLKLTLAAPVTVSKAHAVSLALVTFRTAYLKAHHPAEFMDAFMRSEVVNREKQEMALREWRNTHLRLVPPKMEI
ncbi:MAG: DNA polymerase III subunit alpha [Deltaproteobacteria bacterium]|jgi:DNA polymerase-3 subunit alpha|nr:DNA polymerase III subunit alpha [Deltaproteobacteria bacterium]